MEETDEAVQPSSSKEPSVKEQASPKITESPLRISSRSVSPQPSKQPSVKEPASPKLTASPLRISSPPKSPQPQQSLTRSLTSAGAEKLSNNLIEKVANLAPQGEVISDKINELTETVKLIVGQDGKDSPTVANNVDKIAAMSQVLTNEAKALRQSIKCLAEDIIKTKKELCQYGPVISQEDVSFPYHLFLIELIINKIHMKCECFDIDFNNLIISACFLGKQPIILYDATYGKIDNFTKLNVGKSMLFAMTYDKICSIKEFEIVIELTKQPPCSSCITRIAETHMDYTNEFVELREELCKKWMQEQPKDNITCTTSTPLSKNMYYLTCGEHQDSIGIIEVTVRMSFLGKEITTAFTACPKPQGTAFLCKEDNGMTMYSCQKVEMDDQGKVLLDEEALNKKATPCYARNLPSRGSESVKSQFSSVMSSSKKSYGPVQYYSNNNYREDGMSKYDEICTTMNANELKIKVPKTSRVERTGKYDKIQELCTCDANPHNTGDQIQFAMPPDLCGPDKGHKPYTTNVKYTVNGCNKTCDTKNRKIINVTPNNCPVPVAMEKQIHPMKDVFILKIGKKLETKDKKTDLEIELVTPKAPQNFNEPNSSDTAQQCADSKKKPLKLKLKGSKSKKGKGGKAKKKGKKKK